MLLEAATGKFGLRDETVKREIPFDALRLLRAGSSLRLKNGSIQDDAERMILRLELKPHCYFEMTNIYIRLSFYWLLFSFGRS